ncbi:zinc-binding dehydrogenase [Naasia sp. SYSU D00057]|uniref:zinc-binding dehydrogenase n=1 Tax=Naasia sp. SYSU D00057 TaxID=2817380 RepID=UPI001B3162AD|nr:zinc-binding dehydrogenase [Naasia sp. SYSU D00057]
MKYLLETAPQTVEVAEDGAPALPTGSVRVEVAYVGVCHSDTARVAGGRGPFPARLGHEVSGVVVESAAPGLTVGTRVVAYVEDGYATELIVPAERIVPVHADCSLVDAALAEPLACVIGGIEMLDLAHEREIVLVGSGFMGLMALRLLVANGHRVTVIEPREHARDLAAAWGADRVLHPDEVPDDLRQGCSVVVEATGAASGLQLASDLVRIAGTLGIMGYHQSSGGKRTVDMESWNYRALKVLSLHHRSREDVLRWIDRAQRLSALGFVRPSELADRTIPLRDLPALFADPAGHESIKTVVDMRS